jgi:hypothetical protein
MMQICRKGSSRPLYVKGASRLIVFLVLALFVCAGFAKQSDKKGKRTSLTMAISKDEGKTWGKIRNIEVNPNGWYCYTAIHFTRKDVLLGYCAGDRTKGNGLAVTQITKLRVRSIYQ